MIRLGNGNCWWYGWGNNQFVRIWVASMGVGSYPGSSVFYNAKVAFFRLTKLRTQGKMQSLSQNLLVLRNSTSSSALIASRALPEACLLGAGCLRVARAFLSVPLSSIRPPICGQVPVLSNRRSEHAGGWAQHAAPRAGHAAAQGLDALAQCPVLAPCPLPASAPAWAPCCCRGGGSVQSLCRPFCSVCSEAGDDRDSKYKGTELRQSARRKCAGRLEIAWLDYKREQRELLNFRLGTCRRSGNPQRCRNVLECAKRCCHSSFLRATLLLFREADVDAISWSGCVGSFHSAFC